MRKCSTKKKTIKNGREGIKTAIKGNQFDDSSLEVRPRKAVNMFRTAQKVNILYIANNTVQNSHTNRRKIKLTNLNTTNVVKKSLYGKPGRL
jgi:hypothetical protein